MMSPCLGPFGKEPELQLERPRRTLGGWPLLCVWRSMAESHGYTHLVYETEPKFAWVLYRYTSRVSRELQPHRTGRVLIRGR